MSTAQCAARDSSHACILCGEPGPPRVPPGCRGARGVAGCAVNGAAGRLRGRGPGAGVPRFSHHVGACRRRADLPAAAGSPIPVTTSDKAADATATTTIKVALICAPSGVGDVMRPVLGVWPGPVACVGRMPGCGVGFWACAG